MSPFPPSPESREPLRRGRVIRENTGEVAWVGLSRDAEGEANQLNAETEGSQSFRPEERDDDGNWQSMGFRRGGFRGTGIRPGG